MNNDTGLINRAQKPGWSVLAIYGGAPIPVKSLISKEILRETHREGNQAWYPWLMLGPSEHGTHG